MTEEPCRSCDWLLSLGRNTALPLWHFSDTGGLSNILR